jgi:mannosyltransferase OCH1-like enzyme
MNFLTTIIPLSGSPSHKRRRNLDFLCARLNDAFGQQNKTFIASFNDVQYTNEFAEAVRISELNIDSKFVMFLDPDTFFNFKFINDLVSFSDQVIIPFSQRIHLDEHLTRSFIEKRNITVNSSAKTTKVSPGSSAVIVNSDFLTPGNPFGLVRFGENFEDWWLDFDSAGFKTEGKALDLVAVKLYCDRLFANRAKSGIVHAFNYACVDENSRLYREQLESVDSYVSAAQGKGVILVNFHSGDCLLREGIFSERLGRDAKSLGHSKDFPFLNDIFNISTQYLHGDGWVFYCNSDCRIADTVYNDIREFDGDYIEFQRQEVDSHGRYKGSVEKGIDGIAIRKSLLQKCRMPDLLIGAPYWDDAVSALYGSSCKRKLRIMNQLIHTEHEPTYDLCNLDVAGKLNFESFSSVLESIRPQNSSENLKTRCQILIKISTLGRPELLCKCLDSFVEKMSGNNVVFFCITCNIDDDVMTEEVVNGLKSKYQNIKVFFGDHKSKIEAYNADIENFDFDVLVAASDDMIAVEKDYDQIILDCMGFYFPDTDGALWFETCDGNQRTATLSVMGKSYYLRFGHVYNQDYIGYYCDDEFTQVAFKLGKIKRIDHAIICHNIPDHLKMSDDATYLKSLVYGARDKAFYKVRKRVQFDIPGIKSGTTGDFSEVFFVPERNKHESPSWMTPYPKFDDPLSAMEVYILEGMDRKISSMDLQQFMSFSLSYFKDFRWTIPPIIHQIWFGEVPKKIKEMMATFSEDYIGKNPGSRYILWNEKRLRSLGMINDDIFKSEKEYDCKSDIARLEILNRFGGFYVDSDCVWLGTKPLNSVPSKNGIMIAYEKAGLTIGKGYLDKDTTRCANGVFGASIANPIVAFLIGRLRKSYAERRRHGVVASTGPDFVQGVLDELSLTETASHKYFYPVWWCVNPDKNPDAEKFIRLKSLSPEDLSALYPESVLFHKGFTSSEGG